MLFCGRRRGRSGREAARLTSRALIWSSHNTSSTHEKRRANGRRAEQELYRLGAVAGECLRRGLADEARHSILPVLIGDGIPFFMKLDRVVALHLAETKAYMNKMVELRYEVRRQPGESRDATSRLTPSTADAARR